MTYLPETDPSVLRAESTARAYVDAKVRLDDERQSGCASPQDIAFWQAEVDRLYREWLEAVG